MEKRELAQRVLEHLNRITGREAGAGPPDPELAVFERLAQVEKIVSSIQKYLPKRVIDKILLNPEGVKVEGERRQVTILFGDLSGFTAMSETMDPEQVVEVVNQYFDTMVEIAARYGGHIDKFMGDALMVLFGAPVAHEDDPLRACLAAIEMLEAMDRFSAERKMDLAMSIGLNTGEVVALNVGSKERMEYTVIGDGVNLAARLEKVATARQCVIGENTYRQVRGKIKLKRLKPVMVKGKSRLQNVYLIEGRMEEAGQSGALRSGSIKLVGRMAEMESIRQSIEKAKSGRGQVVAITGEPGVGKSRVAKELELVAKDRGFRFAKGKCHSYSGNIAYLPFIRQMGLLLSLEERDSPQRKQEKVREGLHMMDLGDYEPFLGSLLGLDYPEIETLDPEKRKRKTFQGIGELYRRLGERQPLCLAFEDLQWADSLSLELLEHLVDALPGQTWLVCADYRPELALPFIARPCCLSINLRPLGKQEVWQMVSYLAAVSDVDDQVLDKLLDRTEGNPLFIEEVIRHLLSGRLVKREGENLVPTKRFGKMTLPNTVASVVLGRVDRLGEELRRALQYAAVIGKEFDRTVLAKLLKEPEERVQSLLDNLEHFEGLLYSKLMDTRRIYEFHSTTTHEAAYSTLLKQRRKELHGRVAMTLETEYRDNLWIHLEDLAHHYYNSSNLDKASLYLHRAGDKSRNLYANSSALDFYQKGLEVLKHLKNTRQALLETAELLGAQGAIFRLTGDRERALKNFTQAAKIARQEGEDGAERKYLLTASITYDMLGQARRAMALWNRIQKEAGDKEDHEAQALALQNQGLLYLRKGEVPRAMDNFQRALKVFEQMKAKRHLARINDNLSQAHEMMGNIDQAVQHISRALELSSEINYLEGVAIFSNNLGQLMLTQGELDEANRHFQSALTMSRKIGDKRVESLSSGNIGLAAAMGGDFDRALEHFQISLEISSEMGDLGQEKNMLDNLGTVHQFWGNPGSALEKHQAALGLAVKLDDLPAQAEIYRNLGIDHMISGDYSQALSDFERAGQAATEVGDPRMQAYVKSNLGSLLYQLGRMDRAGETITGALEEARKVRDPEVILAAARALVEYLLDTGDLTGAEEHASRVLGLAEKTQNKREMAYGLMNIARLLMKKGELGEMAEPLAESLGMARELKDKMLLDFVLLLHVQKALAEGDIRQAEDFLKDSAEIAEKTGSPDLLFRVAWHTGRLAQQKGLSEQAKEEERRARGILDNFKQKVPEEYRADFVEYKLKTI